jgi:plastocyanin
MGWQRFLRAMLAVIAVLSISALSACGGGGGTSSQIPTTPSGAQQNTNNVNGGTHSTSTTAWQLQAGGDHHRGALQALAMLPETITIDEGDSITWTIAGEVHTVTFLGSFNAPPGDPTVPQGGTTFNGTNFVSSGILPPGAHYTLTFTKAGTYTYHCFLHFPEMSGVVVVQPHGTPYPRPQGFYTGRGNQELNSYLSEALSSVKAIPFPVGGTTLAVGVSPGTPTGPPTRPTVLRFLDGDRLNLTSVTIPVGTKLTWVNLSNNEPHTVTFPVAGQPLPPLPGDPFTPPIGGPTYDGTSVTNSGPLFGGQSYSLTVTKAGTFEYMCLFHDEFGMVGTVIVK